jgi:hypothetical protein
MDIDELDPKSSLALAIVDEGSSPSPGELMRLGEQLESLRSIIRAFQAPDTDDVKPATPPPAPSWGPFVLREVPVVAHHRRNDQITAVCQTKCPPIFLAPCWLAPPADVELTSRSLDHEPIM